MTENIDQHVIPVNSRVRSIDVFRGLTIFVMIFVNDLAGIRNIPGWMQHAAADADTMTFVDVVFPAFLFIVGLAIPFAINSRLARGETIRHLWKHILIRTAGLVILGFYMVNIGRLNPVTTGMSKSWWMLLMFISAILVWNNYPSADGARGKIFQLLRVAGVIGLIFLAVIYRSGPTDLGTWMRPQWWGILGLIGWAYLFSVAVYFASRKRTEAIVGMVGLCILLYLGERAGALDFLGGLNSVLKLGSQIGSHSALTLSGILVGQIIRRGETTAGYTRKLRDIIVFAVLLSVGAYLLRPVHGISKIYATPSWVLYSAAICCVSYAVLYWLVDVKQIYSWARFLSPAGRNPLLAYILPSIVVAIFGILGFDLLATHLGSGLIGILRSLVMALLMLWLTDRLSRLHVRLHL